MGYTSDTIEAPFIDPADRGLGGGTLLIARAEQLATGPLSVDVNEQNPEALGFYAAQGFQVVGHSPVDSGGRPFPLVHMRRPMPVREPFPSPAP